MGNIESAGEGDSNYPQHEMNQSSKAPTGNDAGGSVVKGSEEMQLESAESIAEEAVRGGMSTSSNKAHDTNVDSGMDENGPETQQESPASIVLQADHDAPSVVKNNCPAVPLDSATGIDAEAVLGQSQLEDVTNSNAGIDSFMMDENEPETSQQAESPASKSSGLDPPPAQMHRDDNDSEESVILLDHLGNKKTPGRNAEPEEAEWKPWLSNEDGSAVIKGSKALMNILANHFPHFTSHPRQSYDLGWKQEYQCSKTCRFSILVDCHLKADSTATDEFFLFESHNHRCTCGKMYSVRSNSGARDDLDKKPKARSSKSKDDDNNHDAHVTNSHASNERRTDWKRKHKWEDECWKDESGNDTFVGPNALDVALQQCHSHLILGVRYRQFRTKAPYDTGWTVWLDCSEHLVSKGACAFKLLLDCTYAEPGNMDWNTASFRLSRSLAACSCKEEKKETFARSTASEILADDRATKTLSSWDHVPMKNRKGKNVFSDYLSALSLAMSYGDLTEAKSPAMTRDGAVHTGYYCTFFCTHCSARSPKVRIVCKFDFPGSDSASFTVLRSKIACVHYQRSQFSDDDEPHRFEAGAGVGTDPVTEDSNGGKSGALDVSDCSSVEAIAAALGSAQTKEASGSPAVPNSARTKSAKRVRRTGLFYPEPWLDNEGRSSFVGIASAMRALEECARTQDAYRSMLFSTTRKDQMFHLRSTNKVYRHTSNAGWSRQYRCYWSNKSKGGCPFLIRMNCAYGPSNVEDPERSTYQLFLGTVPCEGHSLSDMEAVKVTIDSSQVLDMDGPQFKAHCSAKTKIDDTGRLQNIYFSFVSRRDEFRSLFVASGVTVRPDIYLEESSELQGDASGPVQSSAINEQTSKSSTDLQQDHGLEETADFHADGSSSVQSTLADEKNGHSMSKPTKVIRQDHEHEETSGFHADDSSSLQNTVDDEQKSKSGKYVQQGHELEKTSTSQAGGSVVNDEQSIGATLNSAIYETEPWLNFQGLRSYGGLRGAVSEILQQVAETGLFPFLEETQSPKDHEEIWELCCRCSPSPPCPFAIRILKKCDESSNTVTDGNVDYQLFRTKSDCFTKASKPSPPDHRALGAARMKRRRSSTMSSQGIQYLQRLGPNGMYEYTDTVKPSTLDHKEDRTTTSEWQTCQSNTNDKIELVVVDCAPLQAPTNPLSLLVAPTRKRRAALLSKATFQPNAAADIQVDYDEASLHYCDGTFIPRPCRGNTVPLYRRVDKNDLDSCRVLHRDCKLSTRPLDTPKEPMRAMVVPFSGPFDETAYCSELQHINVGSVQCWDPDLPGMDFARFNKQLTGASSDLYATTTFMEAVYRAGGIQDESTSKSIIETIQKGDGKVKWNDDNSPRNKVLSSLARTKNFAVVARNLGCSVGSLLVEYYRWKVLNQPEYLKAKRKAKKKRRLRETDDCAVCRGHGKLIVCDSCERTFHLDCASPPLKSVPEGQWFCFPCASKSTARRIPSINRKSPNRLHVPSNSLTGVSDAKRELPIDSPRSRVQNENATNLESNPQPSADVIDIQPPPKFPMKPRGMVWNIHQEAWLGPTLSSDQSSTASSTSDGLASLSFVGEHDVELSSNSSDDEEELGATKVVKVIELLSSSSEEEDEEFQVEEISDSESDLDSYVDEKKKSENSLISQQPGHPSPARRKPQNTPATLYRETNPFPVYPVALGTAHHETVHPGTQTPHRAVNPAALNHNAHGSTLQSAFHPHVSRSTTGTAANPIDVNGNKQLIAPTLQRTVHGIVNRNKPGTTQDRRPSNSAAPMMYQPTPVTLQTTYIQPPPMEEYTIFLPFTVSGLLINIWPRHTQSGMGCCFASYRRDESGNFGPAEASRMFRRSGDVFLAIDNTPCYDMSFEEVKLLLGLRTNGQLFKVVKMGSFPLLRS